MANFAKLEARIDAAVISQLMDDAAYQLPGETAVATRAEVFYEQDDGTNVQRTVKSIALAVADVPAPQRDAVVKILRDDGTVLASYVVLAEVERDVSFVHVRVRPLP